MYSKKFEKFEKFCYTYFNKLLRFALAKCAFGKFPLAAATQKLKYH